MALISELPSTFHYCIFSFVLGAGEKEGGHWRLMDGRLLMISMLPYIKYLYIEFL